MQDLNDMYLFAKVVEHGGYTAASRVLGTPVSKISRRIAELEDTLGVRLLNRTTRKVSVTDVGQTFYRHCAALAAEAVAAKEAIDRTTAQPHGLVRVSCPVGLLQNNVSDIISAYLARYPEVRIHLDATSRRVDVVEEGFDVALRVRMPPFEDSELIVRPLATALSTLVASPAFLQRHGPVTELERLSELPTVSMLQRGERYSWSFTSPDGSALAVVHHPRLVTDDLASLCTAALQGCGVALLPKHVVGPLLRSGELVSLLPEYTLPQGVVQAVYASRRGLVPAVREFVDALVNGFRSMVEIGEIRITSARLPLAE